MNHLQTGIPQSENLQLGSLLVEARQVFEKLSWPQRSWEAWRRTPLEKVQPEQRFAQYTTDIHTTDIKGRSVQKPVLEQGLPRDGWALEVRHNRNSWFSYRSEESQPIELYDLFSPLPREAIHVLKKRMLNVPDRMQAWSLAYPTHGLVLKVPDGVRLSAPILIQSKEEGENLFSFPHLLILMGKNSEAQIVVRFDLGNSPGIFFNGGITYQAEENAQGTLVVDRLLSSESGFFLSFEGYLQRDATLQSVELHLGGQVSKSNWKVELEQEGAKGDLRGAYMAHPESHLEMELTQAHRSGRTQSNSLYKGIVSTGGKSVFQGLIVVGEGAAKTDAYLANRNLLLGSGARADSIPRLVIGNDDVRCTHGSTTGRLNETQLFYLRSRGLPLQDARRILIEGFFEEVIARIPGIYREDVLYRIAEAR